MNNHSLSMYVIIVLASIFSSCKDTVKPPQAYGVLPTEHQLAWQQMEYYMFIHFGPNTFTDVEWGDGNEDPKVFNPSNLDCRQWAATAKAAGMKGIIITAKHHDGFCLWPSKYSTHTVRESPWKDGKGDLLKELSEACKEYDLKFGVYLSPWDQNHPDYGTPQYNQIFANTLTEVLTNYGDVFEQWFDGANGEGHEGKKQVYDWNLFHQTVYKNQPQAIIFSDIGPGCRWIGNEQGYVGETNWSRLNIEEFEPGKNAPIPDTLNTGNIHGLAWVPAEADVSIRPGWFFSPSTNDKVKTVTELMDIYNASVGRNANLLLNVPPDRTGRIHANDSIRLMEFRQAIDNTFNVNLAKGATLNANQTRGNSATYQISNLLNDDYDSYWTTDDSVSTASIELELAEPKTFNRLLLQEYIPLGQRISEFNVEYWNTEKNNWDILTQATTIGYKRILLFPTITTQKIRINILQSLACPILNSIGLYYAFESTTMKGDENIQNKSITEKWNIISPQINNTEKIIDGKIDASVSISTKEAITIDLGETTSLKGFFYIPENTVAAANISRYSFSVSTDNKSWTKLKTNAIFNNVRNNPTRQDVLFENNIQAKYIKLEPLELTNNSDKYTVTELGIITK